MSTTYKHDGNTIQYANGTGGDLTAGTVIDFSTHIAVLHDDVADGETGAAYVTGVHELAAENDTAWNQGDELYWTGTLLTTTAGTDTPAGTAWEDKAETTAVGKVNLRK